MEVFFSGFRSDESEAGSENEEIHEVPIGSVLMQTAKTYEPTEDVLEEIDMHVTEMVNYLLDYGMRDEDNKLNLEDDITKRPTNFEALSPMECSAHILEALKTETRKSNFRMKEIIKAAMIII